MGTPHPSAWHPRGITALIQEQGFQLIGHISARWIPALYRSPCVASDLCPHTSVLWTEARWEAEWLHLGAEAWGSPLSSYLEKQDGACLCPPSVASSWPPCGHMRDLL